MDVTHPSRALRLGLAVFIIGTAFNVAEFTLAVTVQQGVALPIILMACFDAGLIAYVFMHLTQLGHPEG